MDDKKLIGHFRDNGFKVTMQRLAICKYVLARDDHPSVEQIYQSLRNDYPTISLGTVYKTLHLLQELGLVQELGFNEGSIRYDPNMSLHINIVCPKCGKIRDYNNEKVKDIWHVIISDLNIKPRGQRIDIYSECEECKILNDKEKE